MPQMKTTPRRANSDSKIPRASKEITDDDIMSMVSLIPIYMYVCTYTDRLVIADSIETDSLYHLAAQPRADGQSFKTLNGFLNAMGPSSIHEALEYLRGESRENDQSSLALCLNLQRGDEVKYFEFLSDPSTLRIKNKSKYESHAKNWFINHVNCIKSQIDADWKFHSVVIGHIYSSSQPLPSFPYIHDPTKIYKPPVSPPITVPEQCICNMCTNDMTPI